MSSPSRNGIFGTPSASPVPGAAGFTRLGAKCLRVGRPNKKARLRFGVGPKALPWRSPADLLKMPTASPFVQNPYKNWLGPPSPPLGLFWATVSSRKFQANLVGPTSVRSLQAIRIGFRRWRPNGFSWPEPLRAGRSWTKPHSTEEVGPFRPPVGNPPPAPCPVRWVKIWWPPMGCSCGKSICFLSGKCGWS